MTDNNQLNDIILNKNGVSSSNKKIILAIATLGIILIIVVMLMNSLTSTGTQNLPQAVLPPQPKVVSNTIQAEEEPLFQEVEVIEDNNPQDNLAAIAKKLKKESLAEDIIITKKDIIKKTPLAVIKKTTEKRETVKNNIMYYVQVGSFSKYEPNEKFLNSIKKLGYKYKYHSITVNKKSINKVLVGPFDSKKEAKNARRILRSKIEPGAFLFKL